MDENRKSSLSDRCTPFPLKLHAILSRSDCEHIITWLPHGHSWRILQPMLLETEIIPLYFRHSNLSSFMRQVNGWGFQRLYKNGNESSYHHKFFIRDTPNLCKAMRRSKCCLMRGSKNSRTEPDFDRNGKGYPICTKDQDMSSIQTVKRFDCDIQKFSEDKKINFPYHISQRDRFKIQKIPPMLAKMDQTPNLQSNLLEGIDANEALNTYVPSKCQVIDNTILDFYHRVHQVQLLDMQIGAINHKLLLLQASNLSRR